MQAFIGMRVMTHPTASRRRGRRRDPRRNDFQVADLRPATPVPRRPRADSPQDSATYSCQCGFVFVATVSTSVACPHCGSAQAW